MVGVFIFIVICFASSATGRWQPTWQTGLILKVCPHTYSLIVTQSLDDCSAATLQTTSYQNAVRLILNGENELWNRDDADSTVVFVIFGVSW